MKYLVIIIVVLVVCYMGVRSGFALEQPSYSLVQQLGRLEIRRYDAVVLATTELRGDYDNSLNGGFRNIASYIFGQNNTQEKISMTAPVLVENPYTPTYNMSFVMPKSAVASGLPTPLSAAVEIEPTEWGMVAVWQFGGWATEKHVQREWAKMRAELDKAQISYKDLDMIAQYNAPTVPPPWRRNELWVFVK